MKIGMILDESFPPDPRVENEALTLIAAGHEVHLFCLGLGKNANERETHAGIEVYRYAVPSFLWRISALAYTFPYYHQQLRPYIDQFLLESDVEVLHVHDIRVARPVFALNKKYKLPLVLDLHENRPEIMKHYAHVRSWLGRLLIYPSRWKKWEFDFIRQADRLIVVTEAAKEYYADRIGKSPAAITVVPNTVRRAFYEDSKIDQSIVEAYREDFVILYLGDTGLRRGLLTAISAMPDILKTIPNARLLIVGRSKDDELLRARVRQLGITDRVIQLGWQDFGRFPSYITASDIGICPLHRNLHHDTTYANKVFQSLAFGKPVVVSDATAQARLVEKHHCGAVFTEKDETSYAAAVIRLAQDKQYYDRMSRNAARAIREDLRWEVYAKALVGLYADLLTHARNEPSVNKHAN